jgi:hemin uptake protein HemP
MERQVIKPYDNDAIEAHAAKSGGKRNLREISIVSDDGEYEFLYLVKKPSRAVLEAIAAEEAKKEKMNTNNITKLMLGCVLEGDKEAYEHDGAIYSQLLTKVGELIKTAKGDLKKL